KDSPSAPTTNNVSTLPQKPRNADASTTPTPTPKPTSHCPSNARRRIRSRGGVDCECRWWCHNPNGGAPHGDRGRRCSSQEAPLPAAWKLSPEPRIYSSGCRRSPDCPPCQAVG